MSHELAVLLRPSGSHCGLRFHYYDVEAHAERGAYVLHHLRAGVTKYEAVCPNDWVPFPLRVNALLARQAHDLCSLIAYEQKSFDYGFNSAPNIALDLRTGAAPPGAEFTCTTLLVALLRSAQLPLIDLSTWPPASQRPADLARLRALFPLLYVGLDAAAMERRAGEARRVTPVQLAAATLVGLRATYQDVEKRVPEVEEMLAEWRTPGGWS